MVSGTILVTVRNFLDDGFRNNFAYSVRNFLYSADSNFFAYGYWNFFLNTFPYIRFASNLFANSVNFEHLAAAFLRRNFAANAGQLAWFANSTAGSRIKHRFARCTSPLGFGGCGDGVVFYNPFANSA